ncbi:hypothetical protein MLD38_018257 [Melastoma candidum]|uniref:Uncharacterized protein n=1 Tax=Melastoma candidum TaxID=119954 RepID=A0ACB9QUK0_9MYRT|nr:hypothetical protein MLD38_018257 [Melastoma candidum]
MEKENAFLEVHLISAQDLKPPPLTNMRRTETYALVWVDPSVKLRSRVDRFGAENPTWNDKFFFRVTPEVLAGDTSTITVEIYAVGYIRDYVVGTVRMFLSSVLSDSSAASFPPCIPAGIRRPSGKIQGVLNIGMMLIDGSDFHALKGATAIGYRDLMGETIRGSKKRDRERRDRKRKQVVALPKGETDPSLESCETSCGDSGYFSDGCDSTTSSSSTASTVLKDWNGMRELAGKSMKVGGGGAGFLCGLLLQK